MIQKCIASYRLLWKHKQEAVFILLCDLLFILGFTTVFYLFQEKLSTLFLSVSQLLALAGTPSSTGPEAAQEFLSKFPVVAFVVQFAEIIKIFSIVVLARLVLWIVFHGIAWKKSYAVVGKKTSWVSFYRRFGIITVCWSVVFLLTLVIAVKVSSLQLVSVFPALQILVKAFFGAVFGVLTYLSLVSYGLLDMSLMNLIKKLFVVAYRRFVPLFALFVLILVKIYAALWLVKNSLEVAIWLPLVLFLVVFLPVMAWSRIAFLLGLKKKG